MILDVVSWHFSFWRRRRRQNKFQSEKKFRVIQLWHYFRVSFRYRFLSQTETCISCMTGFSKSDTNDGERSVNEPKTEMKSVSWKSIPLPFNLRLFLSSFINLHVAQWNGAKCTGSNIDCFVFDSNPSAIIIDWYDDEDISSQDDKVIRANLYVFLSRFVVRINDLHVNDDSVSWFTSLFQDKNESRMKFLERDEWLLYTWDIDVKTELPFFVYLVWFLLRNFMLCIKMSLMLPTRVTCVVLYHLVYYV